MPRGAEYDDGVPQSDNAIEAGETLAHGTGPEDSQGVDRSNKAAPLPEGISEMTDATTSAGSAGHSSGKGGHEPHSLGEGKGMGKHMGDERLDAKVEEKLGDNRKA